MAFFIHRHILNEKIRWETVHMNREKRTSICRGLKHKICSLYYFRNADKRIFSNNKLGIRKPKSKFVCLSFFLSQHILRFRNWRGFDLSKQVLLTTFCEDSGSFVAHVLTIKASVIGFDKCLLNLPVFNH